MLLRCLFTTVCFLLLVTRGVSQTLIPRFETLDVENGLSQNSVYSIHQDKRGFMWFGTADGLSRYDGERLTTFRIKGPPLSMASNTVRGQICEDSNGWIWYVNETGIFYVDPLREEAVRAVDFLEENKGLLFYYSALATDAYDNLWLFDPTHGIVQFAIPSRRLTLYKFPEPIEAKEYPAYASASGKFIYLFFEKRSGTLQFDTTEKSFQWIMASGPAMMGPAGNGNLFKIEGGTISLYSATHEFLQEVPLKKNLRITSVRQDTYGRIWAAGMGDGLQAYFPSLNRAVTFRHDVSIEKSLPFDMVTCLYIDATNNLWIGTDGGGVSRLNLKPPRFNVYPMSPGVLPALRNNFTRCLYEDERGRIWFGTLNNGFAILDPRTGSLSNYMPESSVGAIFQDREKNIWVGHGKSVSLFDESKKNWNVLTNNLVPYSSIASNNVYLITQNNDGEIFVGTFYGVYVFKKVRQGEYVYSNWKNFTLTVTGIELLDNGHTWIASPINGLFEVRPEDPDATKSPFFFRGIDVRSLHRDENDPKVLWLCSGSGLIRFHTETHDFKLYDEASGLPGGFAYGLVEDDNHNFWISTNKGLSLFNPKTETFQNFTSKDGLQSNEFNTGAFYKGPSGTMYFGGIKGFNWFKTGAEHAVVIPPRAGITGIKVNDKPLKRDSTFLRQGQFQLAYHENDLSFEFAAFEYTRPEANKIQYRLEGWDNQWITADVQAVRYSRLPPGPYNFRVRASAGGDTWGEEDAVRFSVRAPFWNTQPFYLGIVVLLLAGVAGTTRMVAQRKVNRQLQELEKQKAVLEERERISKDIHDDLGSGLSKISILSELAQHSGNTDDFTRRQLEKISASSHELIDNMGDLIWLNNPANDSLLKLFSHMREHLSAVFEGTGIQFKISLPDIHGDVPVASQWRRNIFLAAKEAVHNIVKHANANAASLEVVYEGHFLKMKIADDGKGFLAEEKKHAGYGLTNIRGRVESCGGTLKIDSGPGKGTVLWIELPLAV